jgi:hypothetical protein
MFKIGGNDPLELESVQPPSHIFYQNIYFKRAKLNREFLDNGIERCDHEFSGTRDAYFVRPQIPKVRNV